MLNFIKKKILNSLFLKIKQNYLQQSLPHSLKELIISCNLRSLVNIAPPSPIVI